MARLPDAELVLVPGGTLITKTAEEGRALALTLARHVIHNLQPDLPGRSHDTLGQEGWEEVPDFALDWAVSRLGHDVRRRRDLFSP